MTAQPIPFQFHHANPSPRAEPPILLLTIMSVHAGIQRLGLCEVRS